MMPSRQLKSAKASSNAKEDQARRSGTMTHQPTTRLFQPP
jgi:hypothetical protein